MSSKVPSQAKFYGIQEGGYNILNAITYWLNGNELTIRGGERRFSSHHDVPLEDMFWGINWEYDEDAHEQLLDTGLLEETYVARRKIDWAPTQQGRKAIRDITPVSDKLAPKWTWATERTGPLYGDPNEGVTHRKSVLVAGFWLIRLPFGFDSDHGLYGIEYYPTDSQGEFTHDYQMTTGNQMPNIGVEAITDHNNTEQIINKWKRYQEKDRITFWVFDRRETAIRMFNALDERGELYLDRGAFQNPSNWASKSINRKIWRSSLKYRDERAGDVVFTLTQILEGGKDAILETVEDYLSYD